MYFLCNSFYAFSCLRHRKVPVDVNLSIGFKTRIYGNQKFLNTERSVVHSDRHISPGQGWIMEEMGIIRIGLFMDIKLFSKHTWCSDVEHVCTARRDMG